MKTVAKVFVCLTLAAFIIFTGYCLLYSVLFAGVTSGNPDNAFDALMATYLTALLVYGFYSIIVSIGSLVALKGKSKGAVTAWAIFLIPTDVLASVFMFCVSKEDLDPRLRDERIVEERIRRERLYQKKRRHVQTSKRKSSDHRRR